MRTSLPPLQRKHYLGDLFLQSMRFTLKGRSAKQAIHRCSNFSPQCPDIKADVPDVPQLYV